MVQITNDLVVGANLLHLVFVAAHLRRKPLHGHFHAAEIVETLIDNSHPTLAELTQHYVTPVDHGPRS